MEKRKAVNLNELKTNPNNPRFIRDQKFNELKKSLKDFPKMMKLRPIVVDESNVILGGNMRFRALLDLGYKQVPGEWVVKDSDLTAEEKQEFIIKDNLPFGEWDWDILANEWDEEKLEEWGLEYDWDSVGEQSEAEEDDYEIPEQIKTDIVKGDLFEFKKGNLCHRLLCGDSTIADDVEKLMDGDEAVLMATDPPYGVNYNPEWRNEAAEKGLINYAVRSIGKVQNDDRIDWAESYNLFSGNVVYIWHDGRHASEVQKTIENSGFKIISQIIWAKPVFAISRGDYHWQHEPCWYACRKGKNHNWQGSRSESTLWKIERGCSSKTGHGTEKPLDCFAIPIKNNTASGESVYDPFIGSGTTMVAAHQLNRNCYGMELDEHYCQVIVDRMMKLDPDIALFKNGEDITEQYGSKM